ncbi:unnamed protein product [Gongylonema pulchrum]|uniref:Uncharacterized protein n=1 Tax=Gongylonema pulchrum TaxID=637853 RepID=A0A183EHI6_9BILA|nr:unnamed protein product [Gongylonema pulchrum]
MQGAVLGSASNFTIKWRMQVTFFVSCQEHTRSAAAVARLSATDRLWPLWPNCVLLLHTYLDHLGLACKGTLRSAWIVFPRLTSSKEPNLFVPAQQPEQLQQLDPAPHRAASAETTAVLGFSGSIDSSGGGNCPSST